MKPCAYLKLILLTIIFRTAKGTHLAISPTGCHVFTKYVVPDDKICLTSSDLDAMSSVYVIDDLKLVSSDGSPLLLSTKPCSCPGSLYINDTMPGLYKQKYVTLRPSGYLGTFNCGDFYLLSFKYLQYFMNAINADFCLDVDTEKSCKTLDTNGTNIDNSLKTCPEVQPVLLESEEGRQLEPVFLCIFPPLVDDVIYDVFWFINDAELTWASSTSVSYSDINSTALRPSNWIGNFSLNFEVACAIKAHNPSTSISGPIYRSPKFFAGIKPEQKRYYVNEGITSQIKLTSTIPFSCPLSLDEEMREAHCTYYFYVWTPAEDSCRNGMASNGIALTNQPCGVKFNFRDWGNRSVYINVTGYVDGMINYNDRTTYLHIASTRNPMDPLGIWDSLSVEGIEVKVTDRDILVTGRQCISSNDPHMTTFDGRRWENQRTGIFALYQHKTLPYTVHVIYSECMPWRATCNCGVAIRNGFSYYIVRTCEIISLQSTKLLSIPYEKEHLCEATDLKIVKFGKHYTVTFPSGTQVSFFLSWNNFIGSVRIRASVSDIESSLGLCGLINGKTSDDFIPKGSNSPTDSRTFALSWRIPMDSKESLFSKSSSILQDTSWMYRVDVQPESRETYCTCAQNGPVDTYQFSLPNAVHCNMTSPSQLCEGGNSVLVLDSCSSSDNRKRRSTEDTDDVDIESELTYDTDYNESVVIEAAQWMNGWDETSAREFCSKQFDLDPAVDVCDRLVNISKGPFIDECVADIKISGNTTFIQDTLDTLKGSCLTEATRNEAFYEIQSSDTNGVTLFDYISSFLCPGNCSGNGLCINATCSCFDGFLGSDCSGKLSVPPKDFLLPSNGLCDTRSRGCLKTNILGFFDVENVSAKFEYFKVKDSEIRKTNYVRIENTTYYHYNKISAELPKPPGSLRRRRATGVNSMVYGWNISLSYDGKTYSSQVSMLIFDGQVYKCDARTLVCSSLNQISTDSSNDTETYSLALIVGLTVGLLLVVIAAVVVVVLKKSMGTSVVSTIDISSDHNVPVQQEKSMPSLKILNDGYNNKAITLFKEKLDINSPRHVDVFFTPSSSPEVSIPPLGHCMKSKESKSLSIESYD